MMKVNREMWEERYSGEDYAYGTEPNGFFRTFIDTLEPGRILLPADGEGRNGVYAATRGWDVLSLDFSHNARKKAIELAKKNDVQIHYLISDLFLYPYPKDSFDVIALIYVHLHPENRYQLHRHVLNALKPGGTVILEAFGKEQIHHASGGPRDINMLFSKAELQKDFEGLDLHLLEEKEILKKEGLFHEGKAHVVRMIGSK